MSEEVAGGQVTLTPDVRMWWSWHGGAYIELGRIGRGAREVINVWDDEKDKPTIERSQNAAENHVRQWIKDYDVDALVHDIENNWY